jgi:hypothetical protein
MRLLLALVLIATVDPAFAGSTTQKDFPTIRFYTPDGKSAGTATTYGNVTKFYAPNGRLTGSAAGGVK